MPVLHRSFNNTNKTNGEAIGNFSPIDDLFYLFTQNVPGQSHFFTGSNLKVSESLDSVCFIGTLRAMQLTIAVMMKLQCNVRIVGSGGNEHVVSGVGSRRGVSLHRVRHHREVSRGRDWWSTRS